MKDAKGHGSNPRGAAHQAGVNSAGMTQLYRGESAYNKGGRFYTTDPEWARQFTQSGQESEVLKRQLPTNLIHEATHIYAGDLDAVDAEIANAKAAGRHAIRLNEGPGQPHSVLVFNKVKLR